MSLVARVSPALLVLCMFGAGAGVVGGARIGDGHIAGAGGGVNHKVDGVFGCSATREKDHHEGEGDTRLWLTWDADARERAQGRQEKER